MKTPAFSLCSRSIQTLAASALLTLCAACSSIPSPPPKVDFVEPARARPRVTAAEPAAPSGSLFRAASYRPAFEDQRARVVGDTVTIQIVENITASQKSSSTIDRSAENKAGITAFPFLSKTLTDKTTLGASSSNVFAGKGGTESTNTFLGAITSTVVEVLPNGHLVVMGEKQIGVNQNVDVLRFSGTVDPRLMLPGSIINSTQVADVRVESNGRGAQGEAQTVGWMSRFFLTISPF